MKSLFINTTEKIMQIAYQNENDEISIINSDANISQTEQLFKIISKLLGSTKISDLQKIIVLTGPGSFTGIRLGIAFVKGVLLATKVKIIPIDNFTGIYISMNETEKNINICYVTIPLNNNENYIGKITDNSCDLNNAKIINKNELDNITGSVIQGEIDPVKILKYYNIVDDNFKQQPIIPTYIKPHYAS